MRRYLLTTSVAVAALAVSAFVGTGAMALPVTVGYSTSLGGPITDLNTGDGSTGVFGTNVVIGSVTYTINMTAQGTPPLSQPKFNSNTVTVTASGVSAPSTIYLWATETGLSTIVPGFAVSFTNNALSDDPLTMSAFWGPSSKYTTANSIGTSTDSPGQVTTINTFTPGLTSPYALTEVFALTFTANDQNINATIDAKAIPEPMSVAAIGAGLGALGLIRRRRNAH